MGGENDPFALLTRRSSKLGLKKAAAEDRARIIGPYDFQEKKFSERPTILDYTNLTALMAALPISVTSVLASYQAKWIFGSRIHQSWKEAAWQAIMDHFSQNCTWRQLRVLSPVRPLRVELQLMKIPRLTGYNYYFGGEDFSARWLCEVPHRTPEDPVILYLHGGSYALKTQRPQIAYMTGIARMTEQYRVSILILDYTIGPFAKHPTQLNEGLACYRELRKSCNHIIAFGDSCGGHLALAMLLSGARFSLGLMLISPSTDMTNDAPEDVSMREVFVDQDQYELTDPLISPLYADPAVWPEVLPRNTALVWGGAEESKPQMIEWGTLAKVHAVFEEPRGSHDCMLRGTKNAGSRFVQTQLLGWIQEYTNERKGVPSSHASSHASAHPSQASSLRTPSALPSLAPSETPASSRRASPDRASPPLLIADSPQPLALRDAEDLIEMPRAAAPYQHAQPPQPPQPHSQSVPQPHPQIQQQRLNSAASTIAQIVDDLPEDDVYAGLAPVHGVAHLDEAAGTALAHTPPGDKEAAVDLAAEQELGRKVAEIVAAVERKARLLGETTNLHEHLAELP